MYLFYVSYNLPLHCQTSLKINSHFPLCSKAWITSQSTLTCLSYISWLKFILSKGANDLLIAKSYGHEAIFLLLGFPPWRFPTSLLKLSSPVHIHLFLKLLTFSYFINFPNVYYVYNVRYKENSSMFFLHYHNILHLTDIDSVSYDLTKIWPYPPGESISLSDAGLGPTRLPHSRCQPYVQGLSPELLSN